MYNISESMSIARIKRSIRKLIIGHDLSTYFFAQGGEDATLMNLFHKKLTAKEKGFFVDVGAYHPCHHSNTYLFYINGWSGINIDPCPGSMDRFDKLRPRDINLEIGVSDEEASLTYYYINEKSTMNSFSVENLIRNGMFNQVKKKVQIPVKRLDSIFEEHLKSGQHIDFLSIDVEGLDLQVLRSNDWSTFRPDVVAIELNCVNLEDLKHDESAQFLESKRYTAIAKNVILRDVATVFFVSETFDY